VEANCSAIVEAISREHRLVLGCIALWTSMIPPGRRWGQTALQNALAPAGESLGKGASGVLVGCPSESLSTMTVREDFVIAARLGRPVQRVPHVVGARPTRSA
jgi:hypothetical protein